MKHAIPVKFIAIVLCAASLLAAAGSGLSIIMLAENNLYNQSVEDLYASRMEDEAYMFAEQLAQNYASVNLGGCPEEMVAHYHYLNSATYGYTLKDAEGTMLDSVELSNTEKVIYYTFSVSGSYMKILDSYTTSADATLPPSETGGYDIADFTVEAVTPVYGIYYEYGETSESAGSDEPIGALTRMEDGSVEFVSSVIRLLALPSDLEPTQVVFFDEDGEVLFLISHPTSAGLLRYNEEELLCFTPAAGAQEVLQVTIPATEPVSNDDAELFTYFDSSQGCDITLAYQWEVMPTYTVEVTLLPDAISDTDFYSLAGILRAYREWFPWLLGVGILLFAVTLVYLCCAAGRKPGSAEVRPTALNRLPLDLYLGIDALAVTGLAIACVEGGRALFRENYAVGLGFAAACGYAIVLIAVAFIFAFAAQAKSKNRYWLRNTICGRILILTVRFFRWVKKSAWNAWPGFRSGVKACCRRLAQCIVSVCRFIKKAVLVFWAFLIRIAKTLWKHGAAFAVKAYRVIKTSLARFFSWLGRKLARFYSLLPLTWQWLLMGFLLLFMMFLAVRAGSGGWLLFFICVSFAIILYGAHCFGVLLESARRMRKGDLDTKVDDRLLIGSFKDFSGELNALAGVTTLAVQKQLKSERMKAELVTNVSHDIKTPLTSIINYVDLMKKPHCDEDHELYLEVLDRQSQRLKKLIDDLMEMSKASTGNISVELIQVNAVEAVNQALGEFSDKLASVQLTPVFNHPEEPVTILADGRLLWRVLSNLLSNAFKYALPGTRLYIDLMILDNKAVIAIKNISREQLNVDAAELMERFVRGDASRNTEGSGLGLNIARSLAELQNGQMKLMVDGDLFKVTLLFPLA